MTTVHLLAAGASQAVLERIIDQFQRDTGHTVKSEFGAVGAMKARLEQGTPADVMVLTGPLIDELAQAGMVLRSSRADLGKVGTGVAVRAGTPKPEVRDPDQLRGNLLAASRIVFPDPAVATAGKIVMQLFEKLGISAEVSGRLQFFPNGYAAMNWLAASTGTLELGITQITEILPNTGVTYVGALPEQFQMKALYAAALTTSAADSEAATDFIARIGDPAIRPMLKSAGYEID